MKHFTLIKSALLSIALLFSHGAAAHCQVPCGIYDDHARL